MEHPFLTSQSLEDQSVEDLQLKISDLYKKMQTAYQLNNRALIYQVGMVLESYNTAYQKKISAALEKRNLGKNVLVETPKK